MCLRAGPEAGGLPDAVTQDSCWLDRDSGPGEKGPHKPGQEMELEWRVLESHSWPSKRTGDTGEDRESNLAQKTSSYQWPREKFITWEQC